MSKIINLYIVSGFLGSGKTSFLRNMLSNFDKKKTGVLVNEFGPVSVDSARLQNDSIKMASITNGSIFCSCLKVDFLKALIAFSKEDIEFLFIENSGLADPSNMRTILNEIGNKTDKGYNYKGSICIADSTSFLKHVDILPPIQNQIAHSNFVVLNKTDRVNNEQIDETRQRINMINPNAFIYSTIYAEVPLRVFTENLTDSKHEGETSNKPYNRMRTYALETDKELLKEDITTLIDNIKDKAYRIKGYVKSTDTWLSIDVTDDETIIKEIKLTKRDIIKRTRIVVIGNSSVCIKSEILNSLNNNKEIEIIEG